MAGLEEKFPVASGVVQTNFRIAQRLCARRTLRRAPYLGTAGNSPRLARKAAAPRTLSGNCGTRRPDGAHMIGQWACQKTARFINAARRRKGVASRTKGPRVTVWWHGGRNALLRAALCAWSVEVAARPRAAPGGDEIGTTASYGTPYDGLEKKGLDCETAKTCCKMKKARSPCGTSEPLSLTLRSVEEVSLVD